MPEPDPLETLLRRSLMSPSAPSLSPEFEQKLTRRLAPRRLAPKSRRFLIGYSLAGLGVSAVAMHASGLDVRLAAASILVPLALVVPLARRYFR